MNMWWLYMFLKNVKENMLYSPPLGNGIAPNGPKPILRFPHQRYWLLLFACPHSKWLSMGALGACSLPSCVRLWSTHSKDLHSVSQPLASSSLHLIGWLMLLPKSLCKEEERGEEMQTCTALDFFFPSLPLHTE